MPKWRYRLYSGNPHAKGPAGEFSNPDSALKAFQRLSDQALDKSPYVEFVPFGKAQGLRVRCPYYSHYLLEKHRGLAYD
jgi:hypothetical protein